MKWKKKEAVVSGMGNRSGAGGGRAWGRVNEVEMNSHSAQWPDRQRRRGGAPGLQVRSSNHFHAVCCFLKPLSEVLRTAQTSFPPAVAWFERGQNTQP